MSELPPWLQVVLWMAALLGVLLGLIANIRLDDLQRELKERR
jgi:hypothetical protein